MAASSAVQMLITEATSTARAAVLSTTAEEHLEAKLSAWEYPGARYLPLLGTKFISKPEYSVSKATEQAPHYFEQEAGE